MRGRRPDEALLDTADLGNSVRVVEEIRFAPVRHTLFVVFAAAAIFPKLPLLLFHFPMDQPAQRVRLLLVDG
jgi:hypothetical protein